MHSQLPYPAVLCSTSILHYCIQRALFMPPLPTWTRDDEEQEQVEPKWDPNVHATVWKNLEILGLIDHCKSIIANVGYEYVEEHMPKTCTGVWAKPTLEDLACVCERGCQPYVFPIIFWVAACLMIKYSGRSEKDATRCWIPFWFSYKQDAVRFEACSCGSFHLTSNWIYASRTKEIFDIIIYFPDSMGALYDLRVYNPNFFSDFIQLIDICSSSGLPRHPGSCRGKEFCASILPFLWRLRGCGLNFLDFRASSRC